jgi:hypothetical protein
MLNSRLAREFGRAVNTRQSWVQASFGFLIAHAILAGGLGLMNFKVDHQKSPFLWFAGGCGAVIVLEALFGLVRREVVPYDRGYVPPQADPRELAEPQEEKKVSAEPTSEPQSKPTRDCPSCNGRGYHTRMAEGWDESGEEYEVTETCRTCHGTGTVRT